MDDIKEIKTMLKAVINGQQSLRQEMNERFENVDKRFDGVDKKFENVDKRFDRVENRLDTIGKQVAYLEDDAPTREEYNNLEKRVEKIELN